ncbi:MAG: diacylglycerol kinase family protein [Methylococcales bacterium]
MQIALLSNPNSGRKKHLQKICELAQTDPNISHFQASNTQQFIQFVEQLQLKPVDIVAINAGDGTIQALLTLMFAHLPVMPLLAILKGGTTNMTGGDVGIQGNCVAGLKRLIQWNNNPNRTTSSKVRPVLKIDWDATASPVCGMFFGAGAIIEGQDYFHNHLHKKGLRDSFGPALSALRILFALNKKEQPLFSPVSMQLSGYNRAGYNQDLIPSSAQPTLQSSGKHLLAFASGLERLFLGIHPFWGGQDGAWYFSAVRHQPDGYSLLKILPLFRGKPRIDMTPEQGFLSAKLNHLEMQLNSEFTVDGERYSSSSENHLITISLAGYATFLQL